MARRDGRRFQLIRPMQPLTLILSPSRRGREIKSVRQHESSTHSKGRRTKSLVCGLALVLLCSSCGKTESSMPTSRRAPGGPVTFNRDIAPITFKHCSPCHRPSQSGPFSLLTYSDVRKRAREIAKVTLKRVMPPWLPEPGYGEFKEERRLSEEEIRLIQEWVAGGAAEGNPVDL